MNLNLTEKEEKERIEFINNHKNCVQEILNKPFFSTTGGQFTYLITPTGLGNCISIRCNVCGDIKDITDSDIW